MNKARRRKRSGFTMIETVVCSLLVGIVVTGALAALRNSVRTQMNMTSLIDGPLLAEQLLAEATSMPYIDPDQPSTSIGRESSESGGQRDDWDDIDDYDGWSREPPLLRDGTQLTQFTGWHRAVEVDWAVRADGNKWILYDTGLKRIVVTVTAPDGVVTRRVGYRSKDGVLEQPPAVDRTVVTELQGTLQLGTGAAAAWQTNLLNHAEDPNA